MIMQIRRVLWLLVAVGGAVLYWWYMHGPWQDAGDTLLSHDIVRFGPVPACLTVAWCLILLIAAALSLRSAQENGDTHRSVR